MDLKEVCDNITGALVGSNNRHGEQCYMLRHKIVLRKSKHITIYYQDALKKKLIPQCTVYCTHCGEMIDILHVSETTKDPMAWERTREKIIGKHKFECTANMQGDVIV